MANLGKKGDIYVARFRYGGKEYKKSLKTRNQREAENALRVIETTIHRLATGQVQVPPDQDPGDFIRRGGTLEAPQRKASKMTLPQAVDLYLEQTYGKAESSRYTEGIHLRNLLKHFEGSERLRIAQVTEQQLSYYLQTRLQQRSSTTVAKERTTIILFFRWLAKQGHLEVSPAEELTLIKSGEERSSFRTLEEVQEILQRGGLSEEQKLDLWECLYLTPEEIGDLLGLVRDRAREEQSYLLHAIPAYTGMRRGEVLRLRWWDVDFTQQRITARSQKQSRQQSETTRQIELNSELLKILQDWRAKRPQGQLVLCDEETLEPINKDRANRLFWQPMRGTPWCLQSKKNWFKIGFHTYRHSFASNLAALGVDQRVIDEWMGHQTEAMRKRYRHLFPKQRRAAIEQLRYSAGNDEG